MRILGDQLIKRILLLLPGLAFFLSACQPGQSGTVVPFRAPTSITIDTPVPSVSVIPILPQPTSATPGLATPGSSIVGQTDQGSPCISNLRFIQDVNFPDGTVVQPGQHLTKRWLVENNGSCDWDSRYRLRFSGGITMGAATEEALYPARSGVQPELQVNFTAPDTPGIYRSEWRAYDPTGLAFGDLLYIQINVQTP